MKTLRRCVISALLVLSLSTAYAQTGPSITPDVVYGHKDGMALTFDVIKPAKPNGAGVLFMVSGGWNSRWSPPEQAVSRFQKLLNKGFTMFIVRHGSAPRFNAAEAYGDVQRAVRFVRLSAAKYGVDPNRLGVHGGSAGGHLSLMLGLAADEGDPKATDEVLRASSRVAAVVAYYPPVDLRPRVQASGAPPALAPDAFFFADGLALPRATERWPALRLEDAAKVSPILHVSAGDAPTLLVHGDADKIVDLNASQMMHAALKKQGVESELFVIQGAEHVFPKAEHADLAMDALVAWFEKHLSD